MPADPLLAEALADNDRLAATNRRLQRDNDQLRAFIRERIGMLPAHLAEHTTTASIAPAGSFDEDGDRRRHQGQITAGPPGALSAPKPPPSPKPPRNATKSAQARVRRGQLWQKVRAHLAAHGPSTVSELITATGGSQPGIAKVTHAHAADLIVTRGTSDRRKRYYQLKGAA